MEIRTAFDNDGVFLQKRFWIGESIEEHTFSSTDFRRRDYPIDLPKEKVLIPNCAKIFMTIGPHAGGILGACFVPNASNLLTVEIPRTVQPLGESIRFKDGIPDELADSIFEHIPHCLSQASYFQGGKLSFRYGQLYIVDAFPRVMELLTDVLFQLFNPALAGYTDAEIFALILNIRESYFPRPRR